MILFDTLQKMKCSISMLALMALVCIYVYVQLMFVTIISSPSYNVSVTHSQKILIHLHFYLFLNIHVDACAHIFPLIFFRNLTIIQFLKHSFIHCNFKLSIFSYHTLYWLMKLIINGIINMFAYLHLLIEVHLTFRSSICYRKFWQMLNAKIGLWWNWKLF